MSEPEDYTARVRVFCNDQTRNFHRKHGKTWLADFRKIDRTAEFEEIVTYVESVAGRYPSTDKGALLAEEAGSIFVVSYHGAPGWLSRNWPYGWTSWAHNRIRAKAEVTPDGYVCVQRPKASHEWIPDDYNTGAEVVYDLAPGTQRRVNARALVVCGCGRRESESLPLGALALALDQITAAGIDAVPIDVLVKATALTGNSDPQSARV